MIESGIEYVQELEEMEKSPEWNLHLRLQALNFSFRLVGRNYDELVRLFDVVAREDMFDKIWTVDTRDVLDGSMEEATRLLHNFVSSAKSLVDHTRVHVRSLYKETPFEAEYEHRTRKLSHAPEVRFVQDLRNYSQHYRLPLAGAEVKIQPGKAEERGFNLQIERLREWDNWHQLSLAYMAQFDENIPLRIIAAGYMNTIREFYAWLYDREEDMHKDQLDRLRTRMVRLSDFSGRTMSALKEQIGKEQAEREQAATESSS